MATISPEQAQSDKVRYEVRAAREATGLKQYEFAEKLGISKSYLSDLERGVYVPSPELFAKICRLAKKPPGSLVSL